MNVCVVSCAAFLCDAIRFWRAYVSVCCLLLSANECACVCVNATVGGYIICAHGIRNFFDESRVWWPVHNAVDMTLVTMIKSWIFSCGFVMRMDLDLSNGI